MLLLAMPYVFVMDAVASDGIKVQTDKVQYKTGDDVIITLKNELKEPIQFLGMCSIKECMKQYDEWVCEDAKCDAPQETLVPGEEKDFHIRVLGLVVGDMKYKFDYRTAILERDQTAYSNDFFMISTGRIPPRLVDKQVKKVPVEKFENEKNPFIPIGRPDAEEVKEVKKKSRYVAKPSGEEGRTARKKGRDLPKKFQKQAAAKSKSYGLKNNEVVLAISGIKKKELKNLDKTIQGKLSSVHSIEEIGFEKGVVQYFVVLEGPADEFSDKLKKTEFSNFRIVPFKTTSNYIECALKYK